MSENGDRISAQADGKGLKPYKKPTLKKGPVLSNITARVGGNSGPAQESDIRLKRDIYPVGRLGNGLTLYRFRYLWSDVEMVGVMAQEVLKVVPEAVITGADGYFRVDYGRLGFAMTSYAEWRAEQHSAAAA